VELLDAEQVSEVLAELEWALEEGELVKIVRRRDFADALAFVNEVGAQAELAAHHPDIEIRWDTVTLRLSTHSLGGITDTDIALARSIDQLG